MRAVPSGPHHDPLRALALTVEQAANGEFRWRILECKDPGGRYESLSCAGAGFAAYDAALAAGYGQLQHLVGPDLQFGPRAEPGFPAREPGLDTTADLTAKASVANGKRKPEGENAFYDVPGV